MIPFPKKQQYFSICSSAQVLVFSKCLNVLILANGLFSPAGGGKFEKEVVCTLSADKLRLRGRMNAVTACFFCKMRPKLSPKTHMKWFSNFVRQFSEIILDNLNAF